ncbi:hypothetical protein GALMADRAFT_260011, partial [Galerina marginata CBS 339.88]
IASGWSCTHQPPTSYFPPKAKCRIILIFNPHLAPELAAAHCEFTEGRPCHCHQGWATLLGWCFVG